MNKTLPEVISNILTFQGAVVSQKDEGELEYLAPHELSEKLRIPEYGKIGFALDSSNTEIIQGHYDSELFRSLEKFLWEKGKISVVAVPPFMPNTEKLSRIISSSIGFSNAAFRMGTIEQGKIPYVLFFFKYLALSDDKKEGLCAVLINALTASTILLNEDIFYHIMDTAEDAGANVSSIHEIAADVIQSAYSASTIAIKEKLKDFTKSLERRLNRDIKRVYEYYETLKKETKKLIEKAEKNFKKDEMKKISNKLEAIEAEQKWKVQDLVSKYVLTIDIEPISIIRIETQSTLFWIDVKRRHETRTFALTYNSLLKRLDPLPCEACFYPRGCYYVCDARLHIICADCFKVCHDCGKKYCAACFKKGCPKC